MQHQYNALCELPFTQLSPPTFQELYPTLLQGTVSLLFLPAISMKIHFAETTTKLLTMALSSVPKGFLALTPSGPSQNFRVQKALTALGTTAHGRDGSKGFVCSNFWNSDEEHIQPNTGEHIQSPVFVLACPRIWGLVHCNRLE